MKLWRLHRGLSQAALAQKAGVPQPNLSDMERGEREVSLRTLRALALALGIPAGILADGVGPEAPKPLALSRDRLERIAQAVSQGELPADPREKRLAQGAAHLVAARLRAAGHRAKRLSPKGYSGDAWGTLGAQYRPEEIQSLVERISEKAGTLPDVSPPRRQEISHRSKISGAKNGQDLSRPKPKRVHS